MMYEVENTTLNYLASGKAIEHKVAAQIIDGLIEFDNHSNIVPAMAESWECSDDGLVWTFHLRQVHTIRSRSLQVLKTTTTA